MFVWHRVQFVEVLRGLPTCHPQGQNQQRLREKPVQKLCLFKTRSGPCFFFFSINAGGLSVPITNSLSVAHGCHSLGGALKVKSGHTLKTERCSVLLKQIACDSKFMVVTQNCHQYLRKQSFLHACRATILAYSYLSFPEYFLLFFRREVPFLPCLFMLLHEFLSKLKANACVSREALKRAYMLKR